MLTLFFTFLISGVARAEMPLPPSAGHYEIKGEYQYFTSGANYGDGGNSTTFAGGGHFTTMMGLGQATYDLNKQWRAYASVTGGETNADVYNPALSVAPNVVTSPHSRWGMSEGSVGAQWWWHKGDWDLVPQADVVFPFFRVPDTPTDPLIGEGAMRLQGGAWLRFQHWNEMTYFAYLGAAYRDEGRSTLLPYEAGARYELPRFYLEAEVRGYQTVLNDANSDLRGTRDTVLLNSDGGSYQYYSLNPSRADVAGLAGLHLGPVEIYGELYDSVYGRNSADGWGAIVGLKFAGAMKVAAAQAPENGFEAKPEKYDQGVFQQTEPVTPDDSATSDSGGDSNDSDSGDSQENAAPAPAPKKKAARRKKKPAEGMPNVEMLMKDTQKSLEKKP